MSLGVAMTLPVLLYLLSHITHDRKELVVRQSPAYTRCAHRPAHGRGVPATPGGVSAACHRAPRAIGTGGGALSNHDHIRQTFGDTTAEQCLLRAVVKVQHLARRGPAGRVGTAEFGLLMEGVRPVNPHRTHGAVYRLKASSGCRAWCPKSPCTSGRLRAAARDSSATDIVLSELHKIPGRHVPTHTPPDPVPGSSSDSSVGAAPGRTVASGLPARP